MLAGELAPLNVRINAIAPGFVPTPMHQATLAAGEERAGRMHYQRTHAILRQGGPSMEHVTNCVRMMILPALDELTGKTISSNFDPWKRRSSRNAYPTSFAPISIRYGGSTSLTFPMADCGRRCRVLGSRHRAAKRMNAVILATAMTIVCWSLSHWRCGVIQRHAAHGTGANASLSFA
jgi:hypothetical protein